MLYKNLQIVSLLFTSKPDFVSQSKQSLLCKFVSVDFLKTAISGHCAVKAQDKELLRIKKIVDQCQFLASRCNWYTSMVPGHFFLKFCVVGVIFQS